MNPFIDALGKQTIRNRIRRWAPARRGVPVALLVVSILAASPAPPRAWIPIGAPGGNVRALAASPRDPERIYLGTAEGILYRSDDGGVQWRRLNPGFPLRGASLDQIVIDPRGVVYVGYWEVHGKGGGVARSTNGGQSFTVLKGIDGESVRALALAPSDARVIAAGTLTGVFLSKDAGASWARVSPEGHPDLKNVESLAFDAQDPRVIYAGTWHLPWKTTDAGAHWASAHKGMIDDSDVMTLTLDARDSRTVYATACTGIYRSTAGAATWTKLRGIPYSSRRTRAFAQGAHDPNRFYAGTTEGLYVSADNGDTWARTTPKNLVVNTVVARPDGTILLGTDGAGVLRSTDSGKTWDDSNKGFSERFVFKILFDESSDRLVVADFGAADFGGVFVSRGVSGAWNHLSEGLDGREVLSLAIQGRTLLAGTSEGLFQREPDASTWTRLDTFVDGQEVRPRVVDLLSLAGDRLVAATSIGVIVSANAGRTWAMARPAKADELVSLAVSEKSPDVLLGATKGGFIRSTDGGETWKDAGRAPDGTPHAVAFLSGNDRVVFATTTSGLLRSTNQGDSWRHVTNGLPRSDMTGIAIDPDGRRIYVSDFTAGGIFKSDDGGSTWTRMATDGLGSDRVWALSVDPTSPDRVLAASAAGGLHVYTPVSRKGGGFPSTATRSE